MNFFIAAILAVFAMLVFACKKENSPAPPQETAPAQEAETIDSLGLLLLEQGDDAQLDDAETESAEAKMLNAPIPPSSALSAPLAALAAKARPRTASPAPAKAPEPEPPKPEAPPENAAPKIAHAPNTWTEDSRPLKEESQSNSGKYTIQVGVFPNETVAKKHIAQLAQSGINAYHTRVHNPAKLLGSHYRVRVGYFSERANAETYAKSKLEPIGYAWWVDLSKNDKIGSAELASE